jgi:hypothetical protein
MSCRRTVRDYERLPEHHETIVYWAITITMTRRLARTKKQTTSRAVPQPFSRRYGAAPAAPG